MLRRETYDTLIVPGWADCSHQPKLYPGSAAGGPGGEATDGAWPCWGRNLLFMGLGLLLQPNVLLLPLLEKDVVAEEPRPAPLAVRERREGSAVVTADARGAARRQRYGSTRMTLISTMPAPSRRKEETASFERERRAFVKRNQLLAAPKSRTQSEQSPTGAAGATASRRSRRGLLQGGGRQSLKDKLLVVDESVEEGSDGFGGSLAIPIPEGQAEGWTDDDSERTVATSLPTPRTLRLLTDERFLREHFPERLAARAFVKGERVEADWNSFGQWYSGVIADASATGGGGAQLYTVKYDDDSVEKDVPAALIRPARGGAAVVGELQSFEAPAYEAWGAYDSLVGAPATGPSGADAAARPGRAPELRLGRGA